jgi:hypothetical protein
MKSASYWQVATLAVALILVGCANPGIVQVTEDTYLIKRSDKAGIFGNAIEMRDEVLREADAFAAGKGKVAEEVILNEIPVGMGRLAKVEYTFRLVDPESVSEMPAPRADEGTKDTYTEILKLDDLRQRGLITDEEYEAEKRELLHNN